MTQKLTKGQLTALKWLAQRGHWTTAWWDDKPVTGFPVEMKRRMLWNLRQMGLVSIMSWGDRFDKRAELTALGRQALKEVKI